MVREDWLDDLKQRVDVRSMGEALGFMRRGRRYFCPSCQPSGGKTPDLQLGAMRWKCFKCGIYGDSIALVSLCTGCDFKGAVEWLASFTGYILPDDWRPSTGETVQAPKRSALTWEPEPEPEKISLEAKAEIYQRFLDECGDLTPGAVALLEDKAIDLRTARLAGVCMGPGDLLATMIALEQVFDEAEVKASGLKSFYHYDTAGVTWMVLPYYSDGHPVYLKARPVMTKEQAELADIGRFRNAGGAVPVPYMLAAETRIAEIDARQVLICEGETDTLAALSSGINACGVPGWSHFKPEWVAYFSQYRQVFLAFDGDKAGRKGALDVQWKFLEAGSVAPTPLVIPEGEDLSSYLQASR